jgi:hypothetical protein
MTEFEAQQKQQDWLQEQCLEWQNIFHGSLPITTLI